MGTFISIKGNPHVPREKQAEFENRALTLCRRGGLMDSVLVRMYDKAIRLIREPRFDSQRRIICDYSIFENDIWEPAGFGNGKPFSNKIGNGDFRSVITALYLLWELYSDTPCISGSDMFGGYIIESCVGWINYLFDEDYSIPNRDDYVEVYRLANCRSIKDLLLYIPVPYNDISSCVEYFAMRTVIDGIDAVLADSDEQRNGIMLPALYENLTETRSIIHNLKAEENNIDSVCRRFSEQMPTIPSKIMVIKVIADEFDKDFFDIYDEIFQKLKCQSISELLKQPVEKIPTQEFMDVSTDDMIYFADNLGGISDDLERYIFTLREKYFALLQDVQPNNSLPKTLVHTLSDASESLGNVFMFENTFHEFTENGSDPRYTAMLELLESETISCKELAATAKRGENLLYKDKEHPCYQARLRLNRLMMILANRKIRKEIFEF